MIKQVLVVRKDLKVRTGKLIAQAAHASVGAYEVASTKDRHEWWASGQTKICVQAQNEKELYILYLKAKSKGLPVYLVIDEGRTEFAGVPTTTALGIGPADGENIDEITGTLKLY